MYCEWREEEEESIHFLFHRLVPAGKSRHLALLQRVNVVQHSFFAALLDIMVRKAAKTDFQLSEDELDGLKNSECKLSDKQYRLTRSAKPNFHLSLSDEEDQKSMISRPSKRRSGKDMTLPTRVPTILELKRVLPAHCFQPNLGTSLYFVLKDLTIVTLLYVTQRLIETYSPTLNLIALPLYWYLQGTMMWAIFVLGHDCGHGSFSNSTLLNDIVGNLLHAMILVPYYPWKVSHQHHHKNTANIDRDEIFYPVRERDYKKGGKRFIPLFGLGLSWFIYLVKGYSPRAANHLNPYDPLFARHAINCCVSLACCASWVVFALAPFTAAFGCVRLVQHYLAPVFVFATWLVVTTFLHHQDEGVPWFADHRWSFVQGQLSSVDRHYGWAHHLVHNIGTHQIHHLFSKIPHYHLEEATAVFRREYPHLVRKSEESILPAFCKMFHLFNTQQWIKNETEIHVFSSIKKSELI